MDYNDNDLYPDYHADKMAPDQPASPKKIASLRVLLAASVVLLILFFFFIAINSSSGVTFRIESTAASLSPIKPGGEYFKQLSQALANAGDIIGAGYDPETSRIVIIGDQNPNLPPLPIEDIAVAINTVFSDTLTPPAASIEPDPTNPLADSMFVKFFGNVKDTHFGWVMLEADRKLKGYSLGKDNITEDSVKSKVKNYYNILQLSFSNLAGSYRKELWSRFWLYPARIVASVSENWHAIYFEEARIGVRTETMRWQGNQLVSAGGAKDEKAEYFANHFSSFYDEFSREDPVFAELKRLGKLLVFAQWLKAAQIHFDPHWVEVYRNRRYDTPLITPALTVEDQNGAKVIKIFGGTDLYTEAFWAKDQGNAARLLTEILEKLPKDQSQPDFNCNFNQNSVHAYILPGMHHKIEQSVVSQVTDLTIGTNANRPLQLKRYSHPAHSERLEFGRGWTFNLPRLYSFNPNEKKKNANGAISQVQNQLGIQGISDSNIEKRVFYLYDAIGQQSATFISHAIDQQQQKIYYTCSDNPDIRGLYFVDSDNIEIQFANRKRLFFNKNSSKLQREITELGDEIKYEYRDERLIKMTKNNDEWIRFEYKDDLIRLAEASTGVKKVYEYNDRAELNEDVNLLQFQLEGQNFSTLRLDLEINPASIVLKVPSDFEQATIANNLLKNFVLQHQEKFIANLKESKNENYILQVHDFGNQGFVIQTGDRIYTSPEKISLLKSELEQYWHNSNIVGDQLTAIFGENALKVPDQIILNSNDRELDFLTAHYLNSCGRRALLDDDLAIAISNVQQQAALDKTQPALIIDQSSFKNASDPEGLREGARELIEVFKNKKLSNISDEILKIPEGSNFIIITAENDLDLRTKLLKLGPDLRGKHVILMSCGDIEQRMLLPLTAHQVIQKFNCVGVIGFEQKVEISAVKALLEKYLEVSGENPKETFQEILLKAIDAALKETNNAELIDEISKFSWMWSYISFYWDDDQILQTIDNKSIKLWV